MTNETQPLLPASAWWTSEVQFRAVIALGAQLVSVALRMVGRYTEVSVTTDMVDAFVADLSQAAAILFGILAVIKRQNSAIAPLTLTSAGAEKLTAANPPIMASDPTLTAAPKQTATATPVSQPDATIGIER